MSIMEYNGGAVVAMTGRNCVAIASDTRLGMQAQTVSTNFPKTFRISDKVYVGLSGLATDVLTINERLQFRVNMYKLREDRDIKPSTLGNLLSTMLYERRFGPYFVEPIVVGLEGPENKPIICSMDLIGARSVSSDFAVAGTCEDNLFGMCEALYRPYMEPEDLFETISQCLLSAVDRDALSGWGGVVHVITPSVIVTRHLKARQD